MLSCWEKKIKGYLPLFIACIVFSAVLYSLLMTEQLVNQYDGVWFLSYYRGGNWERSIGRWLWPYVDRIHYGISPDPITSLLSLSFFSLGCILVVDVFQVKRRFLSFLICGLFLSSTTVCCSLSYRYMSPIFALSFLLSIVAAWLLIRGKRSILMVPAGAIAIACSMGLFQMYLGSTCVVILGWTLWALLQRNVTLKHIMRTIARCIIALCIGGILYIVLMKLHLKLYHVSLSDYRGANVLSLSNIIQKLPESILRCYQEFFYFLRGSERNVINAFKRQALYFVLFILMGGGYLSRFAKGMEGGANPSVLVPVAVPRVSSGRKCGIAICH